MALNTHTDHRFSNEPSRSASLSFQISSGGVLWPLNTNTPEPEHILHVQMYQDIQGAYTHAHKHIHTHTGKSQAKGLGIFTGQDDKIAFIDIWWAFLSLCG